jgi:hypothetical protein
MAVQAVLDRGLIRGRSIWPAFLYQVPGLLAAHVSERAVIFGIYSGAYLHGYSYLKEITYETLAQMVLAYDQAMAELTADEQRSVIDVTAKRYIEDQNLAAKDAALLNKERKVAQKASEVDAKIDALESDRQALATKVTELEVAQSKANTLIKELEAKIEEQVLESAHVEAEITRQQLITHKAQLDVIETGIRALEIQAQIADAAYRLASVGIRKAELESDIGRIELDAAEVEAKKTMLQSDIGRIEFDTTEVDVRRAGLESDIGRLELEAAEVAVRKAGLKSDTSRIELDTAEVDVKKTMLESDSGRIDFDIHEIDVKKTMLESDIGRLDFDYQEVAVRKAGLEADIGRIEFDTEEVDLRRSQTEADTARLVTQKETESLIESELTVAQAETTAYSRETELLKEKGPLLDQRIDAADVEISDTIPKLSQVIEDEKSADLTAQESRNQHAVAEYENRHLGYDEKVKTSNLLKDLETANHIAEKTMIDRNADNRASYDSARVWANAEKIAGAEQAADIMAKANIVNTLTHQIGVAK